jgi:hypothetical protein
MRWFLIYLCSAVALLTLQGLSADAQFNDRYCTEGGIGSGFPNCAYRTWQQCLASASGNGRHCTENPQWGARRQGQHGRHTTAPGRIS